MSHRIILYTLFQATVLAVSLSTRPSQAGGVHEFTKEFSNTQWLNGWTYKYIAYNYRHQAHWQSVNMTWNGNAWQAGVNLSQIGSGWLWNNWQYDPLIVWNSQKNNGIVTVSMNGLTVNSSGRCYLDLYDISSNRMTTVATFEQGTHYNTYRLPLDTGDKLYFGKEANVGANYVSSFWNPVITIPAIGTLIRAH
jgi:hypothetical protein